MFKDVDIGTELMVTVDESAVALVTAVAILAASSVVAVWLVNVSTEVEAVGSIELVNDGGRDAFWGVDLATCE